MNINISETLSKIAEILRVKTQQKTLSWTPTNSVDTYELNLGKGYVLISKPSDPFDTCLYNLEFLNSSRERIGYLIALSEEDPDYPLLKDIFVNAENSYLQIDETLMSMLNVLES